jgi:glycosyltransferase involved in cell wall biosynthesis
MSSFHSQSPSPRNYGNNGKHHTQNNGEYNHHQNGNNNNNNNGSNTTITSPYLNGITKPPPTKKLDICIFTPVYPPFVSVGGGVAITYGALYDKLTARGHHVTVISPRLQNIDAGETNLYAGQPVILTTLNNLLVFWHKFKENDVVICPDETQLPFFVFFSHLTGTPLLFNLHTNFRMVLEGGSMVARYVAAPVMDNCLKILSWLAPRTMTTSPSYRDVLISRGFRVGGVFSPRIKLVLFENSDATEEDIAKERKWLIGDEVPFKPRAVLLFAGRWSHEKRINLLVPALPQDCVLAVVGDGPKSQAKLIEKLHNPQHGVVVHRGIVDQKRLAVLYRASDFLVSASAFETLGMTVAEANLCGTPVIVQDAPGFKTQVVEGENGFLIDFAQPNAKEMVDYYISHRPTKQQVLKTSESRWDKDLPNLEEVVEETALMKKEDWDCYKPPLWVWWIGIVLYAILYRIISWPFVIFKSENIYRRVDASGSTKKKLI